jgi:hypothetical protein
MQVRQWHFIGCASSEERASAAAGVLTRAGGFISSAECLRLTVPDDRYSQEREALIEANLARLRAVLGVGAVVHKMELFGSIELLNDLVNFWIAQGRQHILLDVSTMPKRVFFPLLRLIIRSKAFDTLMVTYSKPLRYAEQPLAEDPEPPLPLPLFAPQMNAPAATGGIIAIGLEVLGIVDLLAAGGGAASVHVLFPIPSNADESKRTWTFMYRLNDASPGRITEPRHLSPLDSAEAYAYIKSLTDGFQGYWWLAPFGPKPISIAMAVAAIQHDWPVYYSQPMVYNPAYSVGIGREGRDEAVFGYLIIHKGELQV